MSDEKTSSLPTTTDDAVKLFFPGQKISLKPDNDCPEVSFTICKLSKPVTKSIVVLAKPDSGAVVDTEHVVIKIYDPRYLDQRLNEYGRSYPWDLAIEQGAATNRPEVSKMSFDELRRILDGYEEDEEDEEFRILKEEHYYRPMMESHESEIRAYERLKDLQGSAIPRLILAGQFLPPDERAIQPPALLFEYIPSISLFDITAQALTPVIREQLLSIIESLPSYGVVHHDITLTNIHFTPPERPVRAFILDFGCSLVREKGDEEEDWVSLGEGDLMWAKRMLEDESLRRSALGRVPRSRFQ